MFHVVCFFSSFVIFFVFLSLLFFLLFSLSLFALIRSIKPNFFQTGDDQTILKNWYLSLNSTDGLSWNVGNSLCGQSGVSCDDQTVTELYSLTFQLLQKTTKTIIITIDGSKMFNF